MKKLLALVLVAGAAYYSFSKSSKPASEHFEGAVRQAQNAAISLKGMSAEDLMQQKDELTQKLNTLQQKIVQGYEEGGARIEEVKTTIDETKQAIEEVQNALQKLNEATDAIQGVFAE